MIPFFRGHINIPGHAHPYSRNGAKNSNTLTCWTVFCGTSGRCLIINDGRTQAWSSGICWTTMRPCWIPSLKFQHSSSPANSTAGRCNLTSWGRLKRPIFRVRKCEFQGGKHCVGLQAKSLHFPICIMRKQKKRSPVICRGYIIPEILINGWNTIIFRWMVQMSEVLFNRVIWSWSMGRCSSGLGCIGLIPKVVPVESLESYLFENRSQT